MARFRHRAAADVADGATLDRRLAALFARAPTDRVAPRGACGVSYREEPPWFLAVTAGATLGLGVLGHVLASRAAHASFAATALAVALDAAALAAAARLAYALLYRAELVAERGAVVLRERLGGRVFRERSCDGAECTAALLVGRDGRGRVVLVGARNAPLLTVLRERFIDPPSLARWMTDVAAVVAARAGSLPAPGDDGARGAAD